MAVDATWLVSSRTAAAGAAAAGTSGEAASAGRGALGSEAAGTITGGGGRSEVGKGDAGGSEAAAAVFAAGYTTTGGWPCAFSDHMRRRAQFSRPLCDARDSIKSTTCWRDGWDGKWCQDEPLSG